MSAHTPGPWHVNRIGNNVYVEHEAKRLGEMVFIADLQSEQAEDSDFPELLSNARLIAAAPELLEALQGITDTGKRDLTNPKYDGYFDAARAAIAKATGGQQ